MNPLLYYNFCVAINSRAEEFNSKVRWTPMLFEKIKEASWIKEIIIILKHLDSGLI